ncbi:hypothetical protein [Streptomyces sp. NPDC127038]|uniref:hypothetical protein n=1 Tax=Streptomyces sp. NPDC127038 TaxID=3347114 RepID=UPI003659028E
MINTGLVKTGSVLWLNETQRFFYGPAGERAAAVLKRHLEQKPGVVAVGTLWRNPYWNELTAPGVIGDPHSHARSLLTSPLARKITVPSELTQAQRDEWADLAQHAQDVRLTRALKASRTDGQAVQHLTGGPELVDAYAQGPGGHFTPAEHALITATLDARRLGFSGAVPLRLLADAADGSLEPRQRSADPDWCEQSLRSLTTGERTDGSRSDIRRTLTALHALRASSGGPAAYEPADYLEQHVREQRADQLGSPALWQAFMTHVQEPADLAALARSADQRRLYKHSIQLFARAVRAGHPQAAGSLMILHPGAQADLRREASRWAATYAPLTDAGATARMIRLLTAGGEGGPNTGALEILLARDPAACVAVTDPAEVADMLVALSTGEASQHIATLLRRIGVDRIELRYPAAVAKLLEALWSVDAQSLHDLLARRFTEEAADSVVGDLFSTEFVLKQLHAAGNAENLDALAGRVALLADVTDPGLVGQLLTVFHSLGTKDAAQDLLARNPVGLVDVRDGFVAQLLAALRDTEQTAALDQLLMRHPEEHADIRDGNAVVWLMEEQLQCGAYTAAAVLAQRAAADFDLFDPCLGQLLKQMVRCGRDADAAREYLIHRVVSHGPALAEQLEAVVGPELELSATRSGTISDLVTVAVEQADMSRLSGVVLLARKLREVRRTSAALRLVERVPMEQLDPDDPSVGHLLRELKDLGADDYIGRLLACDPATRVSVENSVRVANWIHALIEAGARNEAERLAQRAAERSETNFHYGRYLLEMLSWLDVPAYDIYLQRLIDAGEVPGDDSDHYGRELDGNPAAPWGWRDLGIVSEE